MVRFRTNGWSTNDPKERRKKKKKKKTYFFFLRISFFRISKERNSKERTKHAYIRTNDFFLSKRISKEQQTNFERTLFDQTTYPETFYTHTNTCPGHYKHAFTYKLAFIFLTFDKLFWLLLSSQRHTWIVQIWGKPLQVVKLYFLCTIILFLQFIFESHFRLWHSVCPSI
jgi:hypothetical protein